MILKKGMKVGFAADHAGYPMKENLKKEFQALYPDIEIVDFGTNALDSVDYPDYAHKLAGAVANGEVDFGVASCGTANGITMTMNRHKGVRATIVWDREVASLVRRHNDANILSIPGRFITLNEGIELMKVFFATEFEGGRHQRRIDKIDQAE